MKVTVFGKYLLEQYLWSSGNTTYLTVSEGDFGSYLHTFLNVFSKTTMGYHEVASNSNFEESIDQMSFFV